MKEEFSENTRTIDLIVDLIVYTFFMLLWVAVTILHAINMKKYQAVDSLDIANIILSSLLIGFNLNSVMSTLSKIIKAKRASKKS